MEATVGTAVHLGKLPMRGAVMGVLGLLCLICLRRLQNRPGVCLLAGLVAVFLKIFTLGGLFPGPLIGITVQALAVEVTMTATGGRVAGAVLGGAVTLATNPLQKLATTWVVLGSDGLRAYFELLAATAAAFGLEGLRPVVLVGIVVAWAAVVGGAGGLWSYWVAGRVAQRLGVLQ
jgi:hypothetical protein